MSFAVRRTWSLRLAVAAVSAVCALTLTHLLWRALQHTPFFLGLGAAILSSAVAGRTAGLLSIACSLAGYALFPLALPTEALAQHLASFAVISGTLSWLVARHGEIEAELRASEARLRDAQELAHVGSWQWDLAGNTLWWSDELYRIFGVDPASFQLSYATFLQLIHPDDRRIIEQAVRGALKERRPYEIEHRIVRPDGEIRVIRGYGRVVLDEHGQVVRMAGATQDITKQKAAEDISRHLARRLQAIFDAEPACVTLMSPDGILLDMNRAGLEMIGAADAAQVIGRPVIDLVHPADRDAFLAMHRQACAGARGALEFRIVGLDGRERWVSAHVVPFERFADAADHQTAILSVTNDVTERKQLEDQLRQSQKLEAVGLLAGGIAHDFNNLLTAISGFSEMVITTLEPDDPRRADLLEVRRAAERGTELVRQLLAFSRRQVLYPRVLDVNALVGDVQKLLRRIIPENIELVLDLAPALEPIRADATQLAQVLLNLAVNARDAMPHGGQLRLVTRTVDVDDGSAARQQAMTPGRYVRLSVSDTGTGMPPEVQARIFEPFFTTKSRSQGTGMGLAAVHGIVKQSGGFISVDSRIGRGTTFEVYLPAVAGPVESADPAEPPEAAGGSETILLAEDDNAVRRLARDTLTSWGYTVLEARNGEEALALANDRQRAIDLLITDVIMPDLGGRALAARLAADRPTMRVLYTSGYTTDVILREGIERDLPFLSKPFLPVDLARAVRAALDAPSPRR